MQVGGTGLTVTGANRVILVDPAWNPSADAQAIDRVHRIGQKQEAAWAWHGLYGTRPSVAGM